MRCAIALLLVALPVGALNLKKAEKVDSKSVSLKDQAKEAEVSKRSSTAWFTDSATENAIVPILTNRKLWASGYDARSVSSEQMSSNDHVWTWTEQTEKVFKEFYDRAMNPEECGSRGQKGVSKDNYGLFSRVRDFQDAMIPALMSGTTVVHPGDQCGGDYDPFMLCAFKKFSKCQGQLQGDGPTREMWVETDGNGFKGTVDSLWQKLRQNGLQLKQYHPGDFHAVQVESDEVTAAHQLGVIRSLLAKVTFEPTDEVMQKVEELEKTFGKVEEPMLTIHVRRSDKMADNWGSAHIPEHFNSSPEESVSQIKSVIRKVEQKTGTQFKSFYIIADDSRYYEPNVLQGISESFSGQGVKALYNPYVKEHPLPGWLGQQPPEVDRNLVADITFAQKHGSYLIGCGSSGISQFLAQKLGAKYRIDPNQLTIMEDDDTAMWGLGFRQKVKGDSLEKIFGTF